MLVSPEHIDHGPNGSGPVDIGARLKRLRAARSLTIAQLAERADVSAGMISQIERGTTNHRSARCSGSARPSA